MIYIDQNNITTRSPYDLFLQDLTTQLRSWRMNRDRIIIFIDANEHILTGQIAQAWKQEDIDLREISHTAWPSNLEPHTFRYGSQPIDGIFASPDVDITQFISLPFHESVGDHRSMIIEITTASAIGQFQGKIVRPNTRRLTTKQRNAVTKYNSLLEQQFSIHHIPSRIDELDNITRKEGYPASPATRTKILTLQHQIDEIRTFAELNCRKIYHPSMPFSPPVKKLYDRIHAFKTLIKIQDGSKPNINRRRAYRTARRCGILNPHSRSIEECTAGIAEANRVKGQQQAKKHTLRREHLRNCLDIANRQGNEQKCKDIRRRITSEHSRDTWRTINRVT